MEKAEKAKFKAADGRIIEIAVLPENKDEWPEHLRKLEKAANAASENAIRKLHAAGIPTFFGQDGKLMKRYPDGRLEVVGNLT